jgi:peroxiredoxin
VDAKTYEKLQGYGIDLEEASGQEHHLLPVPAVFIIDREAHIRFRYFNPEYKERLSGEALLKAARENKPD